MPVPASKDRNAPNRSPKPIPIRNTIHKYFIEILLFILIVVALVINGNNKEIILALIGGIVGRITSK
jgi:hypothetical protein